MGQSFRVYVLAYTVGSICLKKTLQPEALRPSATTSDEIFAGVKNFLFAIHNAFNVQFFIHHKKVSKKFGELENNV